MVGTSEYEFRYTDRSSKMKEISERGSRPLPDFEQSNINQEDESMFGDFIENDQVSERTQNKDF